jgi:hypothetical protein
MSFDSSVSYTCLVGLRIVLTGWGRYSGDQSGTTHNSKNYLFDPGPGAYNSCYLIR